MQQYTTEELRELHKIYNEEFYTHLDTWFISAQELSETFVIDFINWLESEDKHYLLENNKPE